MPNEAEFYSRITQLLATAEEELPPGSITAALSSALREYSRIRPKVVCHEITSTGGDEFSMPESWSETSHLLAVEYPVDEFGPSFLDPQEYRLQLTPSGYKLRLSWEVPSGEKLRVFFTCVRTADEVPGPDFDAVCMLAASVLCSALAAKYSGYYEPSLAADIINYRTKGQDYQRLAQHFLTLYNLHFGMGPRDVSPAAVSWANIDLPPSVLDIEPILHER